MEPMQKIAICRCCEQSVESVREVSGWSDIGLHRMSWVEKEKWCEICINDYLPNAEKDVDAYVNDHSHCAKEFREGR